MDRRRALFTTLGLSAAALGGWKLSQRGEARPRARLREARNTDTAGLNILFVLSDQERSWDLYPAGFLEQHCPARMRLLEQGTYVDGAHTPIQLCSMARGVIYTGVHAQNNGVWENVPIPTASDLSPALPTLGSLLQDAGYRTGYAGKWHLSKLHPRNVPLPAAEVNQIIRSYGFDESEIRAERDGALVGYQEDGQTVAEALRFIDRNRRGSEPWFLAVNLLNPHDVMYYTSGPEMTATRVSRFPDRSVRPPQDPLYRTDLGYDVLGRWGTDTLHNRPTAVHNYRGAYYASMGTMALDDPTIARDFQNYYWNCTRDCDRHLGALLDGLEASGEADRTIIVFTSDHGEYLGVHGLRGKGVTAYREASKIPLVISHPDGLKGTTQQALASQVDILPTLLGLAGVSRDAVQEQLPQLVGHDLSALVDTPAANTPRDRDGILAYWTSLAFLDPNGPRIFADALREQGLAQVWAQFNAVRRVDWDQRGQMRGLIEQRWKFARYFSPADHHLPQDWATLHQRNDLELYDTENDPEEISNLAYDEAYRDQLLAMNERTNALTTAEVGSDHGNFLPFFAR